jgi:DNA-binding MarR family transcriptional regulator
MALKTAQREVERRFNHLLRPLGVTAVQAEALLIIADEQPVSIADLGARMAADPGHPSRLADRLAAAGWIDRRPSPRDGRRTDLTLTPDGRDLVERIVAARRPYVERAAAALAETGLDGVLPDLWRLLDLVRALPEPDDRPGASGPE